MAVQNGVVLAAGLSVLCVALAYGFGLGISRGRTDHNNLIQANGQDAPPPAPNDDAQAPRIPLFVPYRISDEDWERVDAVIARLADRLCSRTKAAGSAREAVTKYYWGLFHGGLGKFTTDDRNLTMPNGDILLVSASRHQKNREEENGRDFSLPDTETIHKGWGGGRNSDTGLLSVQLSDGDTLLFSGRVVPVKPSALSFLCRVYSLAEDGFEFVTSFLTRKKDDDGQLTMDGFFSVWKDCHKNIGDEDRERVDPVIALLASQLSHATKEAESAKKEVTAFYHDFVYVWVYTVAGKTITLPNGDSLRVSATWHQGKASAEEFHGDWGGGRDSHTGLLNILLSDGNTLLLSGRAAPGKRSARATLARWLPWLSGLFCTIAFVQYLSL